MEPMGTTLPLACEPGADCSELRILCVTQRRALGDILGRGGSLLNWHWSQQEPSSVLLPTLLLIHCPVPRREHFISQTSRDWGWRGRPSPQDVVKGFRRSSPTSEVLGRDNEARFPEFLRVGSKGGIRWGAGEVGTALSIACMHIHTRTDG